MPVAAAAAPTPPPPPPTAPIEPAGSRNSSRRKQPNKQPEHSDEVKLRVYGRNDLKPPMLLLLPVPFVRVTNRVEGKKVPYTRSGRQSIPGGKT